MSWFKTIENWIGRIIRILIVFFISIFSISATSTISIYEQEHRSYSSIDLKISRETSFKVIENDLQNSCQKRK